MNAHATIATSGSVIGVRHSNAAGSRIHATAPTASATTIASSTVVSVKPKIDPGSARSKGDTAATSITLAGSAHEPAQRRASDTRGTEISGDVGQEWLSKCNSSARAGHSRCIRGRRLGVNSRFAALPASRGFPNVKLFSRYVTLDSTRSLRDPLAQGGHCSLIRSRSPTIGRQGGDARHHRRRRAHAQRRRVRRDGAGDGHRLAARRRHRRGPVDAPRARNGAAPRPGPPAADRSAAAARRPRLRRGDDDRVLHAVRSCRRTGRCSSCWSCSRS